MLLVIPPFLEVRMDGREGGGSPGAGHGTSPSSLDLVPGHIWSLGAGFWHGTDLELHLPKRSHFITALCGVILLPGQRGTGRREATRQGPLCLMVSSTWTASRHPMATASHGCSPCWCQPTVAVA